MQKRKQHLSAAEGYLTLRMPDHALEELEQIENPRMCIVPFYRIKAEALRQQEKFEDSLHAYGRVLAESPRDTEVLCGMAWCYKRLGQVGKAIAAVEQAYQAEPDNAMILYNLACYNALAGDRSQALSWLGRALRKRQSLVQMVESDPDFRGLREDAGFRFLVDGVQQFRSDETSAE